MLHIPGLARNLTSVSKMGNAGVQTLFEKDSCKMVRGAMVLMRGVQTGTLYKLLGITDTHGCANAVVSETNSRSSCVVDSTIL